MKYTIDYLPEKNIVLLKMTGRLNYQIAEQYSKESVKLARKNDCSKFLFDHRNTITKNGITNIHTTGDDMQQFGFKKTDMIAIVAGKGKTDSNLIEDENRNSNWSKFKYFSTENIQNAFDWLLEIEQKKY